MKINISLCPTDMEINGDSLNEAAVFAAIRAVVAEKYPDARVALQVGYRQGDEWYQINGRDSAELCTLISEGLDWSDEDLYESRADELESC